MNKKIVDIKEKIGDEIEAFFMDSQRKLENEKGYTRYKKLMEGSGMNLLNCLYGLNLMGYEKANQEVIDGEDINNGIGIQITVRKDKIKYRDDTINQFPPEGKHYLKKLIFLTLVYEPKWDRTYKSWVELNKELSTDNFDFNVNTDIYTFDRIHREIVGHTNIDKVYDVVTLLFKIYPEYFNDLYNEIQKNLLKITNLQNIKSARLELHNEAFN